MIPSILVPLAFVASPSPQVDLDREFLAMGTRLTLHLEGRDRTGLGVAAEAGLVALARLDGLGSTWREDSEWSRLNQGGGAWMVLSPEGVRVLRRALHWQRESGGAFDPVLGALIQAWGLRTGGQVPSAEALRSARGASGAHWLVLDESKSSARLGHPLARIEEGAFLKGAALDAIGEAAQVQGAEAGLLDFGGQLLCWGKPREVRVAMPSDRERPRLRLRLAEASLAVSGCSERGRHILDPRTGQPAPDWGSVVVVAPSALDADCLSTALYVLGPTEGLAWAASQNLAAAFLSHDGTVRMTSTFQRLNPTFLSKESR